MILVVAPGSAQIGFQMGIYFKGILPVVDHLHLIALLSEKAVGSKCLEGRAEVNRMVNGKNTDLFFFFCLGHEITSFFYRSFICLTVRSIFLWKITRSKITAAIIARRA